MRKIIATIRNLFRRDHLNRDLDAEVRSFSELLEEEQMSNGMNANDAKRAARMSMGGPEQLKEEIRGNRAGAWIETLAQDLRFASRTLRKNPGFTAIAILTLALGIGANAAIFSLVDAVLLHPLPFRAPNQLVMLWEKPPNFDHNTISALTFLDWKEQSHSFQSIAGIAAGTSAITGGAEAQQVPSQRVSANFFDVLGINPELGRGFTSNDEQPGNENVAVISYGLWSRRFGGNPSVLNTPLIIDGKIVTLIGVLPSNFRLIGRCDLWMPLVLQHDAAKRDGHFLQAIARLKPDVSIGTARAEMSGIALGIARISPETNKGWGVRVSPLQEDLLGADLRATSQILLGAVGFVLLIACANVASLLLVRGAGRTKEIAVRASLGASRLRIARQLITESLLLSLAGAGLGLFFANVATETAPSWLPPGTLPALVQLNLNWRVLAFSLFAALLTGVLCGIAPTLYAGRIDLNTALRNSGYLSSAGSRLRRALAIAEIAMVMILMAGGALLFRTLLNLEHVDRGYRADRVLTFHLSLPPNRYSSADAVNLFQQKTLDELNALPGVRSAALAYDLPLEGWSFGEPFEVAGASTGTQATRPFAHVQGVSTRYFETLGIPLMQGRTFTDADSAKSEPVCIINDGLARKYFPNKNPVGEKLIIGNARTQSCDVVGAIGQVKIEGPAEPSLFELYFPYVQDTNSAVAFALRTDADPNALIPSVRSIVQKLDRDLPVTNLRTIEDIAADSVARPRFRAALIGAFAALALILALIGIYGVLAYSVGQRTREFGIRMALGARRPEILRLVVGDGLRIALIGVAVGLCAAAGLTHYLRSMLWGIEPLDPITFTVVPFALLIVALAACYIPARRATKVDPLIALRYE
jgi:putative ABC transport system permease protein